MRPSPMFQSSSDCFTVEAKSETAQGSLESIESLPKKMSSLLSTTFVALKEGDFGYLVLLNCLRQACGHREVAPKEFDGWPYTE